MVKLLTFIIEKTVQKLMVLCNQTCICMLIQFEMLSISYHDYSIKYLLKRDDNAINKSE